MKKSVRSVRALAFVPLVLIAGSPLLNHQTSISHTPYSHAPTLVSPIKPRNVGDIYGLGTYMAQRYPSLASPSLYRIHLTGIDWVREEFTASHLHSGAQVPYHFGPYDRVVSREVRNHIHILGLLDYNNTFNGGDHIGMRHRLIYSLVSDFVRFAYAVAYHYRHSIFAWQVWNEPNLKQYWKPYPSAWDYAYLLRRTYTAIKNANPKARVVIGGPSASDPHAIDFLHAVAADNGYFDDVALQPYSYVPTADVFQQVSRLRHFHKPIWFSEIGWAGRTGCVTCGDQAAETTYLATIFLLSAVSAVSHVFWYDFRDDGTRRTYRDNFGLVKCDLGAKPAYRAFVLGAKLLNRATLIGIGRINADLSIYQFRNAGINFFAVWNRSLGWRLMNIPWRKGAVHVLDSAGYPGAANKNGVLKTFIPPDAVDYIVPGQWNFPVKVPGSIKLPPRSTDRARVKTC